MSAKVKRHCWKKKESKAGADRCAERLKSMAFHEHASVSGSSAAPLLVAAAAAQTWESEGTVFASPRPLKIRRNAELLRGPCMH